MSDHLEVPSFTSRSTQASYDSRCARISCRLTAGCGVARRCQRAITSRPKAMPSMLKWAVAAASPSSGFWRHGCGWIEACSGSRARRSCPAGVGRRRGRSRAPLLERYPKHLHWSDKTEWNPHRERRRSPGTPHELVSTTQDAPFSLTQLWQFPHCRREVIKQVFGESPVCVRRSAPGGAFGDTLVGTSTRPFELKRGALSLVS